LREHRKRATREQILHAARGLFSERGLYQARIEDLTARAGIAKGTLYLYFRNKEEVIAEVVSEGYELLARQLDQTLDGLPAERTLEGLIGGHFEFFSENPDMLRIFHQARGMLKYDRPEWRPLKRPLEAHVERMTAWLARLPALRRASSTRRRSVALGILGAVFGASSVTLSLRPARALGTSRPWLEPLLVRAATAMVKQR
jgi:AcrR family transcriptional regulator